MVDGGEEAFGPQALSLFSAVSKGGGQSALFIGQVTVNITPEEKQKKSEKEKESKEEKKGINKSLRLLSEPIDEAKLEATDDSTASVLSSDPLSIALKKIYKENTRISRLFSPEISSCEILDRKNCFNLAVVDYSKQKQKEKKILKEHKGTDYTASRIHSYDIQELVDLDGLFQLKQSEHILLYGRAGVGKTSLCKQLVYQWAQGQRWRHIKYLFVIPMRNLTASHYVKESSETDKSFLIKILIQECLKQPTVSESLLSIISDFSRLNEEAVFILDALDEYNLTDKKEDVDLKRVVNNLFNVKNILITSRPHFIPREIRIDKTLEVIGYDHQEIINYIKDFFKNSEDKSHNVIRFIRQSPSMLSLCHIPIHLELICIILSKNLITDPAVTMTELYQKMVDYKFDYQETEREGKDIDARPLYDLTRENIRKILEKIAFLAWTNPTNKNQLSIEPALITTTIRTIDDRITLKQINTVGFLTLCDGGTLSHVTSYFVHPTFQEFLVANYIARGLLASPESDLHKEAIDIFKNNIFNPHYEVIWWFVAGILKKLGNKAVLINFFNPFLHSEKRDLIGIYGLLLSVRCFDECKAEVDLKIDNIILQRLEIFIKNIFVFKENHEISMNFLDKITPILKISSFVFLNKKIKNLFLKKILHEEYTVRSAVVNALNQIAIADEEIIAALKNFIDKETHFRLKEQAAEYFVKLSRIDETIINVFLHQSLDYNTDSDEEEGFHSSSANFFAKTACLSIEISEAICTALNSTDKQVRRSAALIIGKLDKVSPEIITKLLYWLDKAKKELNLKENEDGGIGNIFYALCRHASHDPRVITYFLNILQLKSAIDRSELKKIATLTELNEEKLWSALIESEIIDHFGNVNLEKLFPTRMISEIFFKEQYKYHRTQLIELLDELPTYIKDCLHYRLLYSYARSENHLEILLLKDHLKNLINKFKENNFRVGSVGSKLIANNDKLILHLEYQFNIFENLMQHEKNFYNRLQQFFCVPSLNLMLKMRLLTVIAYAPSIEDSLVKLIKNIISNNENEYLKFFAIYALKKLINHDEGFIDELIAIVKEEHHHQNLKRIAIETLGEVRLERKKDEIKAVLSNSIVPRWEEAQIIAFAKIQEINLIVEKGKFCLEKKLKTHFTAEREFIIACIQYIHSIPDSHFNDFFDFEKYYKALSQFNLTPYLENIDYIKILKQIPYLEKTSSKFGEHINIFQNTPFIELLKCYLKTKTPSYLMAIYNKAMHESIAFYLTQTELEKDQLHFCGTGQQVKILLSKVEKENLLINFKRMYDKYFNDYAIALVEEKTSAIAAPMPETAIREAGQRSRLMSIEALRVTYNEAKRVYDQLVEDGKRKLPAGVPPSEDGLINFYTKERHIDDLNRLKEAKGVLQMANIAILAVEASNPTQAPSLLAATGSSSKVTTATQQAISLSNASAAAGPTGTPVKHPAKVQSREGKDEKDEKKEVRAEVKINLPMHINQKLQAKLILVNDQQIEIIAQYRKVWSISQCEELKDKNEDEMEKIVEAFIGDLIEEIDDHDAGTLISELNEYDINKQTLNEKLLAKAFQLAEESGSTHAAAPKAATETGARLGARSDNGQTSYEETHRRIKRENQEAKLKALERGSGSANVIRAEAPTATQRAPTKTALKPATATAASSSSGIVTASGSFFGVGKGRFGSNHTRTPEAVAPAPAKTAAPIVSAKKTASK